jgi:hypothetical protein
MIIPRVSAELVSSARMRAVVAENRSTLIGHFFTSSRPRVSLDKKELTIAHYFPPAALGSELVRLVRTFFQTAARALASKPALK